MGLSSAASSTAGSWREAEGFPGLLEGFRQGLERDLEAWLAAKRDEAADQGSDGMLELIDGVAQLVTRGGKRLRPALVYYTYRACGGRSDGEVLPLALATELLHTYLLIHDDIMDHADVRRGQPAAHVRFREAHRQRRLRGDSEDFGRSVAILLGDLAHTWAVELATLVPLDGGRSPQIAREISRCFSAMSQEVIGGQYLEILLAQRRPDPGAEPAPEQAEELMRILRLKSGRYTAERPIQLGGLLAGAAPDVLAALSDYGTAMGEAFQLQDDLLGMFGDAGTVGKPVGADLKEGKFTFLIYHALAAASPAERRLLEASLGDPGLDARAVDDARRVIEETGARETVDAMVSKRLAAARAALGRIAPGLEPRGRLFLEGLIDYLRERKQ
ncbi:MAG TPA: polyprenyl synthetase family protein [Thermoanaerobaculia bacterium]|nr:polyprenyl synthetase family protein [Thermoanaerobaculia bacterium]